MNTKSKVNILTPVHSTEVLVRYSTWEALVRTSQSNIQAACRSQEIMLRAAETSDPSDAELPMKIAIMDKNISKVKYDIVNKITIDMSESEKTACGNICHTYRERNTNLENHRGQAYSLIPV